MQSVFSPKVMKLSAADINTASLKNLTVNSKTVVKVSGINQIQISMTSPSAELKKIYISNAHSPWSTGTAVPVLKIFRVAFLLFQWSFNPF